MTKEKKVIPKNSKFEIKSNVAYYLEEAFKARKEALAEKGAKYYRRDLFKEVAMYCGVSDSTISQMHNRNLNASYILAIKIGEFLNVNPIDIWEIVEHEI